MEPAHAPRRRRSTVIATAVLSLLAITLTAFALRYPGLDSSEVEVNNGGVWVTNSADGLLGRLNVDAQELDGRLSMGGEEVDVLQSGPHVIAVGARGATPVNTASVLAGGTVELPPQAQVALGGDRVAVTAADGRVWILTPEQLAAFSPRAVEPAYETGDRIPTVTVGTDGTVWVLDGDQLLPFERSVDTAETEAGEAITVGGVSTGAEQVALTAVGEQPVVLDREQRQLRIGTEVTTVDLTPLGIADLSALQLQQVSTDSEHVLVASRDALIHVPLTGGEPEVAQAGGTGDPVPPAQAGGCSYGAWNGSNLSLRLCPGQESEEALAESIPEAQSGADLALRVNQELAVLNDTVSGLSWMIQDDMTLVDDWVIDQHIQEDDTEEVEETFTTTITNVDAERDQENRPPVANDDEFGVRAGQNVVLPVTRNDTDPDGDVLTASLVGEQPSIGTVTPIRGGTQLQIAVDEDASGSARFEYEVDDGRGGTATAQVSLEVKELSENSGPVAAEQAITAVQVRSGQSVSLNVLPYWEDPEGDAFYLTDATVEPEDLVSFSTDGTVTFDDAGLAVGPKQVTLTFRDEHGATSQDVLEVEAVADPELAPITTADHLQIVAGHTGTINPLVNDINPAGGSLELTHVDELEGLEIEADEVTGSVDISGEIGTYYLEYTASASAASSQGLIRVDIIAPDTEQMLPVAVDDQGLVTAGSDTLIDPLENDVDPTGGVLVVNSVQVPEGSGLKATVVDHHLVRVEARSDAPISEEPVSLTYEVANSAGPTTGTIRVMLARSETQFANPVAAPDEAVVRAGDMVVVDVLDNDRSPTDSELHLGTRNDPAAGEDTGTFEPYGDRMRFTAAPDAAGDAVINYEVVDETGRTGSARLTVTIIPADAPNAPPTPQNLEARTVSGTPVRIPVPLTGIDPDGDSVLLTGVTSPAPELGEVTSATGEWIEYVPHDGARGTDTFQYQVMDRQGAVGTGEVRVGIAEPATMNQPPYAVDDVVEVRPDREIEIPVLRNDSDPEGDVLELVHESVEPTTEIEVVPPDEEAPGDRITAITPSEPGTHSILHEVSDGQLTDSATATVRVDPEAPLLAPQVTDDFVSVADALEAGEAGIQVDVRANDLDPDGSAALLEVELPDGPGGASVDEDGIVTVTPTESVQQIRYTVTDVDGLSAAGYVWVPGTARVAPVWVGGTVEVVEGNQTQIDLSDPSNVRVRPGAQDVRISDPSATTAEHSDGAQLVTDATTLTYRPADGYVGQDSISVPVTDGEVGDATAATGTLVIPVDVTSGDSNQPPTFQGAVVTVESGGAGRTIDLAATANDPDDDPLTFALGAVDLPEGITAEVSGTTLTASASTDVDRGTLVDVPVTVTDGMTDPVSATFQLSVGGSTRPLAAAVQDVVEADAGTEVAVPVLANDSNPFPEEALSLLSAERVSGEGTVEVSGDQVLITPDPEFAGILTASYTIQDATGDPEREVSGEIRVTVRGKPEAPSAPRVGEVGDGTVELVFTAGDDNGAPITGYTVTAASGGSATEECASTSCTVTGLTNGTEYTFQVVAHNEVGDSPASTPSAVARPDVRPGPPGTPQITQGDTQLTVEWAAPENRGSALQRYVVQLQDTDGGQMETREAPAGSTSLTWDSLDNLKEYRFRVQAYNLSEEPSDWSSWSAAENPAGIPLAPSGTVEAERVQDPLGGGIKVSWPAMTTAEANGEPITGYVVSLAGGSESWTVQGGDTSITVDDLDPNTAYRFTVAGVNSVGTGPPSDASNEVTPFAQPAAPASVTATMPDEGVGEGPDGRATVTWEAAEDNGTPIKDYVIRWDGGQEVVDGNTTSIDLDTLENGVAHRFTVQARNRFEGGESAISAESNSVTPYTKPDPPTLELELTGNTCLSLSDMRCTMNVSATPPVDDGGSPLSETAWEVEGSNCRHDNQGPLDCRFTLAGTYTVTAVSYNEAGLASEPVSRQFRVSLPIKFSIVD
ncbi:MAG TPA: tandem-95 repeat protein [Candidatus Brachybacterium merdigallinarum]|nr:tandem-95 repeat protein [Candidatus Brachybacterium merdigallinarum]